MKLRLLENTIRIRLTKHDVETLMTKAKVMNWSQFPHNKKLGYGIMLTDGSVGVDFADGQLTLAAPRQELQDWSHSEKVGFSWTIALGNGEGTLEILLEKDFQCLKERPGEDESNMYPNPNRAVQKDFTR